MEVQNLKDQVKQAFTPARLKKAAVLAVLAGVVTAGGAYWNHQQAEARSLMEKQARTEMIAAQAAQRNIILLDEDSVRTIAAEAIGKPLSELNFRPIYLDVRDHDDHDGKHKNKRKHTHWEDHGTRLNHEPTALPQQTPASPTGYTAASEAPIQPDSRPFYKVKCYAGNMEYKLRIDAVTGTVLSSKAEVDDDIF